VDLNTILSATNLFVLGALLLARGEFQEAKYLDRLSFVLVILLSLQTHVALLIERKHRDPFVILFAITTTVFFSLRVLTLALFPYSLVFERYSYSPGDSAYALVFILVANTALYGGFLLASSRSAKKIELGDWRPTSAGRAAMLLLAGVVFAYSSDRVAVPRVLSFLIVFVSQYTIVLLAFAYYLLFRKSISRFVSILIISLVIVEAVLHFLVGSRSALTGILQNYILVTLAIAGTVNINRKVLTWGVFLLPAAAILLVGSYAISTYIRASRTQGSVFDVSNALRIAVESRDQLATQSNLDGLMAPIFARAGYFDFSAELIANRERYKSVINVPAYGRSIIDNLLTPGFDLFDQPKVSNSLHFVYEELGTPSKKLVDEEYQSDQFGLYGELYTLFSWGSIPIFFILAFLLKRIYLRLEGINPFDLAIKRIVVLYTFGILINSYGLDWVVIEVLPILVAIVVYKAFFKTRRRSAIRSPRPLVAGRVARAGQIQTKPT